MSRSIPLRRAPETPRSPATKAASPPGFAGEIVAVRGPAALAVRRRGKVATVVEARLGILPGYRPAVGDVVAVTFLGEDAVVLGVLEAASPPTLTLPDGGTARLVDGALEIADVEGRLVVRYAEGAAEIAPTTGDLRLSAPAGRVVIAAGLDVAIEAQRDVTLVAHRAAETLIAPRTGTGASIEPAADDPGARLRLDAKGATVVGRSVEVRSRHARLTVGVIETIAREMRTKATRIETTATALETTAERIATKAQSVAEDVTELLETRAGRVRSLVRGVFSLRSRSTTLKSKDDTAIDGRHVLLG